MTNLEPTYENLYRVYIIENTPLLDSAPMFGLSVGAFRKSLAKFEIKKSQKLAGRNASQTILKRYGPNARREWLKNISPESRAYGAKKAWTTRRPRIIEKYSDQGITEDRLQDLFIHQNLSMKVVGEQFGKTKAEMRKILIFFRIEKPKELQEISRRNGVKEYYSDEERVAESVRKIAATCLERYGDNWYYNHASKLELEVLDFVEALLPCEVVKSGDYSVIRKPGSGGAMQLDIHLPRLKKAIEFNGEYWHDREGYEEDLEVGSCNSREMLKSSLCVEAGIELLHVWDSDWRTDRESVEGMIREFLNLK